MATKKAAPKATGKAVTNWDAKLAERAAAAAKAEESSLGLGSKIETRGGIMKYRDNAVPGNKMNAIVLGSILVNTYYGDRRFDADAPQNPLCFAIGHDESSLKPGEEAEDPQNDACKGCPHAEWGSAETGRGKACKNYRRLILLPEGALESGIADAVAATIMVPVTSVKSWAGYVKQLADTLNRPPEVVVTEISLHPDANTQFRMQFKLVNEIDSDHYDAIFEKAAAVETQLAAPYRKFEDEQPKSKKPVKGQKRR